MLAFDKEKLSQAVAQDFCRGKLTSAEYDAIRHYLNTFPAIKVDCFSISTHDTILNVIKAALDKGGQHIMVDPSGNLSIWPEAVPEEGALPLEQPAPWNPTPARLVIPADFLHSPYKDDLGRIACWREVRGFDEGNWAIISLSGFDNAEKTFIRYWTWKPTPEQTRDTPWE